MPVFSTLKSLPSSTFRTLARFDRQHGLPPANPSTMSPKQSWVATSVSCAVFFEWGISYALLDVMNYIIKKALGISRRQAALFAMGYYFAYPFGSTLIASPLLTRCGYRVTMVVGTLILALGTFIMSAGASHCNFKLMVFGHVVIGLGVSTLERSANAYAVNCGPRVGAPARILLGQSVAGAGSVVGPFLARAFILVNEASTILPEHDRLHPGTCLVPSPDSDVGCGQLGPVVSFYRSLAVVLVLWAGVLAGVFFGTNWVPEIPIEKSPELKHPWWQIWKHPLASFKYSRLWGAMTSNFLNLGCQVTIAQFFIEHLIVNACKTEHQATNMLAMAQGLFVIGRILCFCMTLAGMKIRSLKSRRILLGFLAAATGFTLGGVWAKSAAAIACIATVMFWESPSFPMIFEAGTAGLDEWQATAETLVIMSISGGGVLPVLTGMLADEVEVNKAWGLVAGCFGLVTMFPLFLNMLPSWRKAVDVAQEPPKDGEANEDVEGTEMVTPNRAV